MRRVRTALVASCLSACAFLASVEYEYADPAPIVGGKLDLTDGVIGRFPDYETHRKRGSDGGEVFWGQPLEYVATEVHTANGRARWTTSVEISLFGTDSEAAEASRYACGAFHWRFPAAEVRVDERAGTCLSPIREDVNDPEGGSIPQGTYTSQVVIRRERLVVELTEKRWNGAGEKGQLDAIIRDIAVRLSRGPEVE
jgi:hypothetical protein